MTLNRRDVLVGAGALGASVAGLPGVAAGQDCDVSFDTNAETETGEPKLELPAVENAIVSGTAPCLVGSEVTVRLESVDNSSVLVTRPTSDVDEDGRFAVGVDLGDVDPGRDVDLAVIHEGEDLATLDRAEVVAPSQVCTPALDTNAETETGEPKLELHPSEDATISGTAPCHAGEEISLRIESLELDSVFVTRPTDTVSADGTFSVTADLTDLAPWLKLRILIFDADGEEIGRLENAELLGDTPRETPCEDATASIDANGRTESGEPKLTLLPVETTISGTTTCPAGEDITLKFKGVNSDATYSVYTAAVREDGTFSTTVDFSLRDPGRVLRVEIYEGETLIGSLDRVEIVAPEPVDDAVPRDLDDDGLYEDLNANDRLDSDDVAVYLRNYDQPAITDNVDAYDFNRNGEIEFDDIVQLFREL